MNYQKLHREYFTPDSKATHGSGVPKILVRVPEVLVATEHTDSIGTPAQNRHLIFADCAGEAKTSTPDRIYFVAAVNIKEAEARLVSLFAIFG